MRIRIKWAGASNYGKEYEVNLIDRFKAFYSSGHLMSDFMRVKFENGWETSIEMWKAEVLEATSKEKEALKNPIIETF